MLKQSIPLSSLLKYSLQLVEVVSSSVVNIVTEAGSHHGHTLQVSVVTLQITCLWHKHTHRGDLVYLYGQLFTGRKVRILDSLSYIYTNIVAYVHLHDMAAHNQVSQ